MAVLGQAVPGTVVPTGSLTSPGGAPGPSSSGANSWTLTTAAFTVPVVGSTVVVSVQDSSWAVIGEFVWVATAGGSANAPMALQVTAKTPTSVTLLNPTSGGMQPSGDAGNLITTGSDSLLYLPTSQIPLATTSAKGLLKQLSGNTTDFLDGTNNFQNLANAIVAALFTNWTPFTLTVTCASGAIAAQSSNSAYLQIGKLVIVNFGVTISNVGSASGSMYFNGLPALAARTCTFCFREVAANGLLYAWSVNAGGNNGNVQAQGNATPAWTNGMQYWGTFVYQAQ